MKTNLHIHKLVTSGVCLALCLVLPFLTGQIPEIGNMLCPMHIPVLLCGFLCGGIWGGVTGFLAPLLRSLLLGKPVLFPAAVNMAFELFAYGLAAGLLYRFLPKRKLHIYTSLIGSMIIGRIVWGLVAVITFHLAGMPFTWEIFMTQAFVNAVPGIILHIVLIPILVMTLQKAGIFYVKKEN